MKADLREIMLNGLTITSGQRFCDPFGNVRPKAEWEIVGFSRDGRDTILRLISGEPSSLDPKPNANGEYVWLTSSAVAVIKADAAERGIDLMLEASAPIRSLDERAFYTVRRTTSDPWEVAQWENDRWWFCGSDVGCDDVAEVGTKIDLPAPDLSYDFAPE